MEYTKLTLEMTSPEYSPTSRRCPRRVAPAAARPGRLYKGISSDPIDAIFDALYRREATGGADTTLLTNTEVHRRARDGQRYDLDLHHVEQEDHRPDGDRGARPRHRLRAARPRLPRPGPRPDPLGRAGPVRRGPTYTVDLADGEIFVQNAEEHTHGFVAPDLGMGAYRNSVHHRRRCSAARCTRSRSGSPSRSSGIPDRFRTGRRSRRPA